MSTARRREVVFNATGLAISVASIVFVVACAFMIPIPWMLAGMSRW